MTRKFKNICRLAAALLFCTVAVRGQEIAGNPYREEVVFFENSKAGIRLAGTLTLPDAAGRFPAVVLVSGSGAQNRDEELMGHKPFRVIADHLTRAGIAVLRYDDRGTAASEGDFSKATTADLATDAEAALRYLGTRKELDASMIGLAGHSEGGAIAPLVAAQHPGDVAFIILLAAPGVRGDSLLLLQSAAIQRAYRVDEQRAQRALNINRSIYKLVSGDAAPDALRSALEREITSDMTGGIPPDAFIDAQIKQLSTPWLKYFLSYDPAPALEKVSCPVLVLNGEKDLQVPAEINPGAIREALARGGNKRVRVRIFPRLNHLFQECLTGVPAEYPTLERTFVPEVLNEIVSWIKALPK